MSHYNLTCYILTNIMVGVNLITESTWLLQTAN